MAPRLLDGNACIMRPQNSCLLGMTSFCPFYLMFVIRRFYICKLFWLPNIVILPTYIALLKMKCLVFIVSLQRRTIKLFYIAVFEKKKAISIINDVPLFQTFSKIVFFTEFELNHKMYFRYYCVCWIYQIFTAIRAIIWIQYRYKRKLLEMHFLLGYEILCGIELY